MSVKNCGQKPNVIVKSDLERFVQSRIARYRWLIALNFVTRRMVDKCLYIPRLEWILALEDLGSPC